MDKRFLVSIETVKIKDFIFSTNKLKVIRGASYLLDFLNQVEIPEILKKYNFTFPETQNGKKVDENIIYINAGNAKFFTENEEIAKKIIKEIKEKYEEIAPGAKIVATFEKEKDEDEEKIWDLFDRAAEKTAIEKNKGFSTLNIDLPFVQKCAICNNNPAEFKKNDIEIENRNVLENESDGICKECLQKIRYSGKIKKDEKKIGFYSTFKSQFQNKEEFNDFEPAKEISEYKDGKSFIGFMYADGDSLGDFLKNIKQKFQKIKDYSEAKKQYLEFYGKFSEKLDEITRGQLIEVIKEMREQFPYMKGNKSNKKNYGEFLIVGGDDVCAIFPPNLVFEISQRYQEKFQIAMEEFWKNENEDWQEKESKNNITTSCGVVIAKHKTPLHYLFDQSLKLQKSAKKARYEYFSKEENKFDFKKGFIDFQVIGSEGTVNISEFRKNVINLMERPYIIDKFKNNIKVKTFNDFKKELLELIDSKFPKNKLREFYEIKRKYNNKEFFIKLDSIDLVENIRNKKQREIAKKIFFGGEFLENGNTNLKNIFDIIEVYDFIQKSENEEVKNENDKL